MFVCTCVCVYVWVCVTETCVYILSKFQKFLRQVAAVIVVVVAIAGTYRSVIVDIRLDEWVKLSMDFHSFGNITSLHLAP